MPWTHRLRLGFFIFCALFFEPSWAQSSQQQKVKIYKQGDVSFFTGYTTLLGRDNQWPSVNITSPLSTGIKLGYDYFEGPLNLHLDISYRSLNFKNDSKNNIPVKKSYSSEDLNLSYSIIYQTWTSVRLLGGIKYLNLYYFQSQPSQNFVEVKSVLGVLVRLGIEVDLLSSDSFSSNLLGLIGPSLSTANLESGYNGQLSLNFNYNYSKTYQLVSELSYSETYNHTNDNQFTTASKQGRADLALSVGLRTKF